jgi:hypothetical protein
VKKLDFIINAIMLVVLWIPTAHAQWPTNIHENLPVAANPNIYEGYPIALSYGGGRTLVIFETAAIGVCYQLILPNGTLQYPQAQPLSPAHYILGIPKVIRDGQGGVFVAYDNDLSFGMRAQRLDSLGNLLWGDSGVVAISYTSHDFAICSDGQGGIYYAMSRLVSQNKEIYGQHLNGNGQPTWEAGGRRLMAGSTYYPQFLNMAPAPVGDFYLTWEDWRPQIYPHEGTYRQRFDSVGHQMWAENGLQIDGVGPGGNTYQVFSDGRGGFIYYSYAMPAGGVAWRFASDGSQIWVNRNVGGSYGAILIPGEPGYFYLSYMIDAAWKAQRINLLGQMCWNPSGIPMERSPSIYGGYSCGLAYQSPYLYAVFQSSRPESRAPVILSVQKVDSTGQLRWRNNATTIALYNVDFQYIQPTHVSIAPDDQDGAVAVWQAQEPTYINMDIWAKRVNADGSLGGPLDITSPNHSQEFTMKVLGSNQVHLDLPASNKMTLELFDLIGRKIVVVYQGTINSGESTVPIKLDHLSSGMYLLRASTYNQIQVAKIVVLK